MMQMIHLRTTDSDALCLMSKDLPKLPKKAPGAKTFQVFHTSGLLIGEATTCMVEIEYMKNRQFIADVHTGSLYDTKTKRCLTGELVLK